MTAYQVAVVLWVAPPLLYRTGVYTYLLRTLPPAAEVETPPTDFQWWGCGGCCDRVLSVRQQGPQNKAKGF